MPGTANFQNRTLYEGDNLPFLRGINSETIDLVATDPPFNKSKDFHATPDSVAKGARFGDRWTWERDAHDDWLEAIKDNWPRAYSVIETARLSYGDDMGAYLCWLGVRLMEMHRVLKPTGSLYLHIDHTAHAYAKCLLDGIFGKGGFKNEVVWKRTSSHNSAKRWGPVHDTLLFYTRSDSYTWHRQSQPYTAEYVKRFYRQRDKGGRYRYGDLTGPGIRHGDSGQPWRDVDPTPKGRHWAVPDIPDGFANPSGYAEMTVQDRLDVLDSVGLIHWPEEGDTPSFKRYLKGDKGTPIGDVIDDITPISAHAEERVGFPTQKPLALYERIILASSNVGDLVLDPFCGCATTPIAAERHRRQWLGIDQWRGAFNVVKQRMEDNRQLLVDVPEIYYSTAPPIRTDDGAEASPSLVLKVQVAEPAGPRMTHSEMKAFLIQQDGGTIICKGCLRVFDDPRYLELDHNTPRADGGLNHVSNRLLLCGPCNRAKSNTLTLSGLRRLNQQQGWMASR